MVDALLLPFVSLDPSHEKRDLHLNTADSSFSSPFPEVKYQLYGILFVFLNSILGPIYTKRQYQR